MKIYTHQDDFGKFGWNYHVWCISIRSVQGPMPTCAHAHCDIKRGIWDHNLMIYPNVCEHAQLRIQRVHQTECGQSKKISPNRHSLTANIFLFSISIDVFALSQGQGVKG